MTLRQSLAFAILLSSCAFAQYSSRPLSQYSQLLYDTAQGLPQNEVRSIAQTPDGYLWFATRDGLARFDGVRFAVYRKENTPGIGHNMFGALLTDHTGKLWIATGDGLSCYEHGRFKRYTQDDGLPSNAIHALFEDPSGKLWIGTWNGLASFDGRSFRTYTLRDGLPNNSISGIAGDGAGGIWVGTYGGGLAHLTGGRFGLLTHQDGLPSDVVFTILRDRSGRLWAGTLRGAALLAASGKFHPVPELPGRVIDLFEDRNGGIWAVSDKVFARLEAKPGAVFRSEQAPAAEVETLFEDREGTLWVGTTAGIARCRAGPFIPYTTGEGLASNTTQTVFEDSKGVLWIGTANGLSRWFRGSMKTVAAKSALGDAMVNSIAEDDAGGIQVGTRKGVAVFDGHVWKQSPHIREDVHVLFRDHAGRVWIGSPEGVTIQDHGRTTKLTQSDGLPGNYIMSIAEDRGGAVWLGAITGLARVEQGRVTAVYGTKDGLLSNYIQCLYEDNEGALWIGTPGGLHRFKDGRFRAFTEADGMFSDNTLTILEDNQKRLWFSSYRGVFRVGKDDLNAFADSRKKHIQSTVYGTEDGMKSTVFGGLGRQPAGWRTRDGVLWFPTDRGVVSVDPARLAGSAPPPATLLEEALADGSPVAGVKAGPDVRRLEFVFTAPTSIAPESIEFRYRMTGFESDWREVGTQRRISFTSLPRGSYRFAVSARRRGGEWSTQEAASDLEVLPHFYETRWFYAGSGLTVLLLMWAIHSMRLHQTERRLNAVMAERSRVARELHDTLLQSLSGTAMQIQAALRRLRLGAWESGFEQLSAALVHLGKSMADARQAIQDLKTPELEELPLDQALKAAGERVCGAGPSLMYSVSGTPRPLDPGIEQHIYRIGIEAIANAVRHSGCDRIFVELNYREQSIGLSVRDDGSGFVGCETERDPAQTNHWGLDGMRGRARQCGGGLTIDSALGMGTRVQFEAPLRQPSESLFAVSTDDRV